ASLLFGVASVAATERSLEVTAGFDYSTGDYGTSSSTEIVYVPLTLEAAMGSWTVRTTVPYLRITSEGGPVQGPNGPIDSGAGAAMGWGAGSWAAPTRCRRAAAGSRGSSSRGS